LVRRVLDRDGRVLAEGLAPSAVPAEAPEAPDDEEEAPPDALAAQPAAASDASAEPTGIAPVDAYLVTHLMRGVIRRGYGTAHAAAKLDAPLAGKTGSTNRNRDAWFVGYSPRVAAGVWVGYDDPAQDLGRRGTGSRVALPIWSELMSAALPRYPDDDGFDLPDGIHFAWTDPETKTAQRSQRYVAWAEPFATGRKARRSTYVPPPAPPPEPDPAPAYAPAVAPGPPLRAFQGAGAPQSALPIVE